MQALTPLEAAEIMEESARQAKCMIDAPTIFFSTASQSAGVDRLKKCEMAYSLAASLLRAIAAGEYKQVVHCEKCQNFDRKEGMWYDLDGFCERANKFVSKDFYCGFGALMDGKDDSHE